MRRAVAVMGMGFVAALALGAYLLGSTRESASAPAEDFEASGAGLPVFADDQPRVIPSAEREGQPGDHAERPASAPQAPSRVLPALRGDEEGLDLNAPSPSPQAPVTAPSAPSKVLPEAAPGV